MTTTQPINALNDRKLWFPHTRLNKYHYAKATTALIVVSIFIGWAVIHQSNTPMLVASLLLIVVSAWVVIGSIASDRRRARHRQVAVIPAGPGRDGGAGVVLTLPGKDLRFPIGTVARAMWRHDNLQDAGLWMYDKDGTVIAHLDLEFLTDEAEARTFVGWLRRHTGATFPVQWPPNE